MAAPQGTIAPEIHSALSRFVPYPQGPSRWLRPRISREIPAGSRARARRHGPARRGEAGRGEAGEEGGEQKRGRSLRPTASRPRRHLVSRPLGVHSAPAAPLFPPLRLPSAAPEAARAAGGAGGGRGAGRPGECAGSAAGGRRRRQPVRGRGAGAARGVVAAPPSLTAALRLAGPRRAR